MCTKAPREPNKPESKMFRNKTLSVPHENRGRFLNEGQWALWLVGRLHGLRVYYFGVHQG